MFFFFHFRKGPKEKKVSFSSSFFSSLKKRTKNIAAAVDRRAPLKLISSLGLAAGAERGNISLRIKRSSSLEGTHKKRERVLKMRLFFAPSLFSSLFSALPSLNMGRQFECADERGGSLLPPPPTGKLVPRQFFRCEGPPLFLSF